jgi:hypothetical protein
VWNVFAVMESPKQTRVVGSPFRNLATVFFMILHLNRIM